MLTTIKQPKKLQVLEKKTQVPMSLSILESTPVTPVLPIHTFIREQGIVKKVPRGWTCLWLRWKLTALSSILGVVRRKIITQVLHLYVGAEAGGEVDRGSSAQMKIGQVRWEEREP
jgi:hypothetical protein